MTHDIETVESRACEVAALIIRGLSGLGYDHKTTEGGVQTVRFRALGIASTSSIGTVVLCEVDMHRLPRGVSADDLTRSATLHHVGAVAGVPVVCLNTSGVTYAARLVSPPPPPRLPSAVPLELGTMPAGVCMVPVGVGRAGAVWRDLGALGHCLVSGASGSGKSNWLHAALAGLLTTAAPSELRVVLVDPKVSEFSAWGRVPHLWGPIATDESSAARVLGEVVAELDRRGELLAGALVRDLAAYNARAAVKLPRVVVIVDEILDLVLAAGGERSEVARALTRIAVKGRSAGVTLWAATQHGRADMLPRAVAVNLSSRLTFRVLDAAAARLAGCPGAESIPRNRPGRFLAAIDGGAVETYQAFRLGDDALLAIVSGIVGTLVVPGPAALSEVERALIEYAVHELGGGFVIGKLAAAFRDRGITNHQLRGLAATWERTGLLSPQASITAPRMVTVELADLAGVGRWLMADDDADGA